jgi:hypothetical protein
MKLTLFLDNGKIRAFVKPRQPIYPSANQEAASNGRCWDRYEKEVEDYKNACKAAKDAALEVENWQDFFSIERDGLWRKTKGGGFEKMQGEEIALPESIGWEIVTDGCRGDGTGNCGCPRKDFLQLDCQATGRQVIRLKPVEKTFEPDPKYPELLKEVDAVEHKTQEVSQTEVCPSCGGGKERVVRKLCTDLFHNYESISKPSESDLAFVSSYNRDNKHYIKLNTDTQESQVELFNELFEDLETISWSTKLASQELPKKWFLTRKA